MKTNQESPRQESPGLEYGRRYTLCTNTNYWFVGLKQIKNAIYLGFVQPKEDDSVISDGWGHLFLEEVEGNKIFYLARSTKILNLEDEGPIGIQAFETDTVRLSHKEDEYLNWIIKKRQMEDAEIAA